MRASWLAFIDVAAAPYSAALALFYPVLPCIECKHGENLYAAIHFVLVLTRCVGCGSECYQRVFAADAAVGWRQL
jgi:hypothetical protein